MKKILTGYVVYAALFMLCLVLAVPSHAALLSVDDSVFGAGSVTLDTATNLEWLDMSKSYGNTRSYLQSSFGEGGTFEGWRYATADEVIALIQNAGIAIGQYLTADQVSFTAITDFCLLMDTTTSSQSGYSQMSSQLSIGEKYGLDMVIYGGTYTYSTGNLGGSVGTSSTISSWLVRDAQASSVPIPGAVWLLGSGLMGLVGIRRKKIS